LSTAELEGRYETAADPISKSHFHGLWLLSKGLEIEEVAELLSFSTRWVYELVRRYNVGGPDCVNNGAEARILTAEALAALKERIKTPPDDGGLWTGPKVHDGWPSSMASTRCTISVAGMRLSVSSIRSRSRDHVTPQRRRRRIERS
jgi:hypothetical protein